MTLRLGLLRLVRSLSCDRSERRRLGAAVVRLQRQRRFSLSLFGPLLRFVPTAGKRKLQLWQVLARSIAVERFLLPSAENSSILAESIRSTQAYSDAAVALSRNRNGFLQRGPDYSHLRQLWCEHPPQRLLIFHHYDRRGLLPNSWLDALVELQMAGWQVVFSTPKVDSDLSSSLDSFGVQIVRRLNIGRCLGAYRDLALLLHFTPLAHKNLKALVFCNDSNLLVQPPEVLLSQLEQWTNHEATCRPVLAGLTDSVERHRYHLQSFLLYANCALLNHPTWLQFWLYFAIDGSKDDLIDQGEIGLSQALLDVGVELKPAYSLVQSLLTDPSMAAELQCCDRLQIEDVNQSLFGWRSLLARGYPFIKKHVLFQLALQKYDRISIAELAPLIPPDRFDLLARDIELLLSSRFSGDLQGMR